MAKKPPGPPPPPPPRPASWLPITDSQADKHKRPWLKPGQIQFLKKIRDRPFTREDIDYYKDKEYYQDLIESDLEDFIRMLEKEGYIEPKGESPETWSCTNKGCEVLMSQIKRARSNPLQLKNELKSLNAAESLKVATELKRDGNLAGAIEMLKASYEKIKESTTSYGVETYLRLPVCLQLAGRNDEAWGFLNRLITKGYPNQLNNKALNTLDKSKIYHSMSNFLHKEKKHHQAIVFESMSLAAWAQYHYLQSEERCRSREKEMRKDSQRAFIRASKPEEIFTKLVESIPKKARTLELSEVVEYICIALIKPDQIKYDLMYVDVDKILAKQEKTAD